jgi:choline kinase
MRGLVLAAGRGARLATHTTDRPKCLIDVGGRSLLDRQIDALRSCGADPVAVVGGWRHRSLEAPGRIVFVNRQWADTTMVSSLLCAAEWLAEDETMVSYGDILFSRAAAAALSNVAAALAIAFDPEWQDLWSLRFEDPLSDAETFAVDDDGLVIDIGDRPSSIEQVRGQYMGLLRFTPAGWADLRRCLDRLPEEARLKVDMTALFRTSIRDHGLAVTGVPVPGPWCEFDSPRDLEVGTPVARHLDRVDRGVV